MEICHFVLLVRAESFNFLSKLPHVLLEQLLMILQIIRLFLLLLNAIQELLVYVSDLRSKRFDTFLHVFIVYLGPKILLGRPAIKDKLATEP